MLMNYNFIGAINRNSNDFYQYKDSVDKLESKSGIGSFAKSLEEQKRRYPYAFFAKDDVINYNSVIFACDKKTHSICLGDMTDSKRVLNVPLPSGGHLKVNVDNFGDIGRAAGMFSPADLNAIMRAIAQYNHCTSKLNEMEDEFEKEVEETAEQSVEQYSKDRTIDE